MKNFKLSRKFDYFGNEKLKMSFKVKKPTNTTHASQLISLTQYYNRESSEIEIKPQEFNE